jgi:hypothetical protein
MNELWKYAIVAFVCLLLGFTAGYLGDFPNQKIGNFTQTKLEGY